MLFSIVGLRRQWRQRPESDRGDPSRRRDRRGWMPGVREEWTTSALQRRQSHFRLSALLANCGYLRLNCCGISRALWTPHRARARGELHDPLLRLDCASHVSACKQHLRQQGHHAWILVAGELVYACGA